MNYMVQITEDTTVVIHDVYDVQEIEIGGMQVVRFYDAGDNIIAAFNWRTMNGYFRVNHQ